MKHQSQAPRWPQVTDAPKRGLIGSRSLCLSWIAALGSDFSMMRRLVAAVPVRKGQKTFLLSFRQRFDSAAGEQFCL